MDEPSPFPAPVPEEPTRPEWLDEPPVTAPEPARGAVDDWAMPTTARFPRFEAPPPGGWPPPPPRPPGAATVTGDDRKGWLRPAVAGGLVGALVAAAVAGGIVAASDDGRSSGPASLVSRPAVALAPGRPLDIRGVLAAVSPAVVAINTKGPGGQEGAGTGMVVESDGTVLTNAHVVQGASTISVALPDGKEFPAELVGSLPDQDVALLHMRGAADIATVTLGSSSRLQVGDDVVAVGNALGLGAEPTVTRGIVSALGRTIEAGNRVTYTDLIQTDAAINPGNSGGPLVNAAGQVVGVNSAVASSAQNIGFALSIDSVKPLLGRLHTGIGGALLGVTTVTVGNVFPGVLEQFGITRDDGAFVQDVLAGSGAAAAGLRPGDVILGADGKRVRTNTDVSGAIARHAPGDSIAIVYERRGHRHTVTAKLGSRSTG
ncbi:MAG: trypsin-like peptidase domain-containing protein [Acidobacteria bacterium]|nr:trypsin-like peptidase domain-containing protein [Acidobacteriota bacterium]